MKIAICLNLIQPRDGTSHFAMQLGGMLAAVGHEVTLMAARPKSLDLKRDAPGLAFISIGQKPWQNAPATVRRIGSIFQEQQFRVVFVCAGEPVPHLEAALYLMPEETVVAPIVVSDRSFAYDLLQRTAAAWNMAVTISPRLQQIIGTRMPQKAARLLTTGVAQASDAELAERIPLSVPLRLLFVGRLTGRKNVLMLPKILAACLRRGMSATLTVCGYGMDRKPLEQACHEEGLAHLVEFPEIPLQPELYRAMRRHHILLLTSSYSEGLGLVLLEAQANGCVPVSSRLLGVTDFALEEGVTGLLAEVGAIDDFAGQVARLTEPERWQQFSHAGIVRTRRLFTLEQMAQDYATLVDDLASGAYPLPTPRSQLPRPTFPLRVYAPPALNSAVTRLYRRLRRSRLWPRSGTVKPDR